MENEYILRLMMRKASLLINSCEQIFAEKLRSLLRFGPLSTRYKDIFDLCYLKDHVDMPRLRECIEAYIIDEPSMREKNMGNVCRREEQFVLIQRR